MFDDESLFLFDNYEGGRFESVKTKYRISSKEILDLINEKSHANDSVTGDLITDLIYTYMEGRITTEYSEWGREDKMLFTGDDLIGYPYSKSSDHYDEFINMVKLILRQNKVNSLIENLKK